MRLRLTGLWHHPDFVKLWAGQTVSLFGTQVTLLALPLTAALTLDATPAQMGALTALGYLPSLLVGLFAGVWVDRHRRRPLLIASNFGRALLLALIPLAALLDLLRIELLYAVAFLVGTLTVFFGVAYASYLPALVTRAQVVEGNSKLQVSRSASEVAGPGLGGVLVQLLTAPIAILADALSFAIGGLSLLLIRGREPAPEQRPQRSLWGELREGLGATLHNPLLRSVALWAGTFNAFGAVIGAVFILYVTRELGLSPGVLGVMFAVGSVSGLVGAVFAGKVVARFGLGRSMVLAGLLASVSQMLTPLAMAPLALAVVLLVSARLLFGLAAPLLSVNILSLQQSVTPERLLGRVNATMNVIAVGTLPLGALLGGFLGEQIGLRATLFVGALGIWLSSFIIWNSPLRTYDAPPPPSPARPHRPPRSPRRPVETPRTPRAPQGRQDSGVVIKPWRLLALLGRPWRFKRSPPQV